MKEETILFGIPVPSTNKLFLVIVAVHIALGLICVISGLVSMLSEKGNRLHTLAGKVYFWCMSFSFTTVLILSFMRWPHNIHLLTVGTLSFAFAYVGRRLARAHVKKNWTRLHTICMGLSYILLLTGFYIDNGKNLPFWKQFPQLFFWICPSLVGIPIIILALIRHPLNKQKADAKESNPKTQFHA